MSESSSTSSSDKSGNALLRLPEAQTCRRFIVWLVAALVGGVVCFAAMLGVLAHIGRLPPPPLTADACIDEKFKFLAEHDILDTDFIAVGSSVTWRNLDMSVFRLGSLAKRPLNAAPCYLHVSETAYYAEFLLKHLRSGKTRLPVVAPRDFGHLSGPKEAVVAPVPALVEACRP